MRPADVLRSDALRSQAPVWGGLAAMLALSWLYLFRLRLGMAPMDAAGAHHAAPQAAPAVAIARAFVMWTVMMAAMMLPAAVPAVSLFGALSRRRHPERSAAATTALYVAGYLGAWVLYSALGAPAQWLLTRLALLSPMAASADTLFSAAVLFGAGLFQLTPLKHACLAKCRSPLAFFLAEWRDGGRGAFALGLRHGGYCVGCCWALMAVLFVCGVMNLLWMALLTAFLLLEKVAPAGWKLDRIAGVALIATAAWVAAA